MLELHGIQLKYAEEMHQKRNQYLLSIFIIDTRDKTLILLKPLNIMVQCSNTKLQMLMQEMLGNPPETHAKSMKLSKGMLK